MSKRRRPASTDCTPIDGLDFCLCGDSVWVHVEKNNYDCAACGGPFQPSLFQIGD